MTEATFDSLLDLPEVTAPAPTATPEAAPSEPVAETAPAAEAAEATETATPDETAAKEAAKTLAQRKRGLEGRKQSIQEEINTLTRQKYDSQRERDQIRADLEALRREKEALSRPAEAAAPRVEADHEPQEGEFDDYGQFVRAMARWTAKQEARALVEEQRQAEKAAKAQAFEQSRRQTFEQQLEKARASKDDWDDVMAAAGDLPFSRPMQDAIYDSPIGADLVYYLASHPEEHRRIYALPRPLLAYRELSKLEARLEAAATSTGPAPAAVSTAKPPLKPVGGAPATDLEDVTEDLPVEEFIRRANARDRKLRGR